MKSQSQNNPPGLVILPGNEPYDRDSIWNRLQEPARPTKTPPTYLLLLAALDTGWRVLEPIRLGPDRETGEEPVYQILLHRSPSLEVCRLSVKAGPEIQHFILTEGLQVSRGDLMLDPGYPLYLS